MPTHTSQLVLLDLVEGLIYTRRGVPTIVTEEHDALAPLLCEAPPPVTTSTDHVPLQSNTE